VAQKHYLHTTDEHFEQATQAAHKAAQYLSESGENGGTEPQPELAKTKENHISPANTEENEWAMRDSNWIPQPATRTISYVNLRIRTAHNPAQSPRMFGQHCRIQSEKP
jgi:hypothetical protein